MKASEVLAKAVALLHEGDQEGFLAMLDDNCAIMKDDGEQLARGKEELAAFYAPIFADQREMEIQVPVQFEAGNVAALHEVNLNMIVNGVKRDLHSVWIYKVVDNKIAYMHVFSPDDDADEALSALS